jgi:hypothetical protein
MILKQTHTKKQAIRLIRKLNAKNDRYLHVFDRLDLLLRMLDSLDERLRQR